jgi:hypothetical protein
MRTGSGWNIPIASDLSPGEATEGKASMRGRAERDGGLRFGPLGDTAIHLCVDMQNMFAEQTEWYTPWMARIAPNVFRIVQAQAARTIFTRFIPAKNPEAAHGTGAAIMSVGAL